MSQILMVEDKVDNQIVVEDIFEFDGVGAELVIACSAEEALEKLTEIEPVLILMDIGLPGMSGLEAARVIKADPARRHIPIWALTAHAMKEIRDDAIAAGCAEYVTKPIDSAGLGRRLREFVESLKAREAA